MIRRLSLLFALTVIVQTAVSAQVVALDAAFPGVSFADPVDLQHAGDGSNRLFVVEQTTAVIRVFNNDPAVTTASVFLDLGAKVTATGGELGLLGLAFHPEYSQNGYFFVNYTAGSPRRTVVERYRVSQGNPSVADPDSARLILEVEQPAGNHNGGQLAFGPDGFLYIGLGDGGDDRNVSQDPTNLLGSMLRIDVDGVTDTSPDYWIPADNPFVGNTTGIREETWAYGFRNPWRFSFDHAGQLWLGDVGEGTYEEVNLVQKAGNYGWPIMEATHCFPSTTVCDQTGLVLPVAEYAHSLGRSVTGGYVYDGARVPQLTGAYLFADYIEGRIWSLSGGPGAYVLEEIADVDFRISSFGKSPDGEVYVVGYHGSIYHFTSASTRLAEARRPAVAILGAFPNPTSDFVSVSVDATREARLTLTVFDVLGRQVLEAGSQSVSNGSGTVRFDMRPVAAAGHYWIRIVSDASVAWRSVYFVR